MWSCEVQFTLRGVHGSSIDYRVVLKARSSASLVVANEVKTNQYNENTTVVRYVKPSFEQVILLNLFGGLTAKKKKKKQPLLVFGQSDCRT
jgi:hypothetical protein